MRARGALWLFWGSCVLLVGGVSGQCAAGTYEQATSTFTAATADATAGTITVTVEYIVRDSDGSANPTSTQQ